MCDNRSVSGSCSRLVEFQSEQYIAHIKRLKAIHDLAVAERLHKSAKAYLANAGMEVDAAQKKLTQYIKDYKKKSIKTSMAFESN